MTITASTRCHDTGLRMRKRPHVNNYNAQQLRKAIKNMPPEQREDRYWWMHLGPAWDHWNISQLEELLRIFSPKE